MKIAYLANVRLPSERAHAAQIAHMCAAFVENEAHIDLFVNRRGEKVSVTDYYALPVLFTTIRLAHGLYNPRWQWTYYLSELTFTLNFVWFHGPLKYDVVYVRSEWIGFFLSWFIPIQKIIWESHEAHYSWVVRRLLRMGIKTVVISEGIRDAYLEKGVPASHLLVAHDGVDETFFYPTENTELARMRLSISPQDVIVMYIGGFEEWKGIKTFLDSSKLVSEAQFVVIGGSTAEVAAYQATYPQVQFLGQLPYRDLYNNQQAADVLVVPNSARSSVSSLYTSPLKLFAHMASGIPLVVSNIPSLINVTGSDGLVVVEPDSPAALAHGIRAALAKRAVNPEKIKNICRAYTWKKRAATIISFIRYTNPHD